MRVSRFDLKSIKLEIICLCLVLSGVILGTLCFLSDIKIPLVVEMFSENVISETLLSGKVFLEFFAFGSAFLLVIFLSGFSAVYQPFIFISCVLVGICYGYSISQIYSDKAFPQVLLVVITFVIPYVIVVFSLIIATREAFYMSVGIASAIFSDKNFIGFKEAVRFYVAKFFVLEAIIAVGALSRCVLHGFLKI